MNAYNSVNDASTVTNQGSESPITGDSDTETEEEKAYPWIPMVEEKMQKHKTAF